MNKIEVSVALVSAVFVFAFGFVGGVLRSDTLPNVASVTYTIDTATTTDPEPSTTAEESTALYTNVACPFSAGQDRFIVDFTKDGSIPLHDLYIVADKTPQDSYRHILAHIDPGVYRISLASYGVVFDHAYGYEKKWRLIFFNDSAVEVVKTPTTRSVDMGGVVIERVHDAFELPEGSSKVFAQHGAYPSAQANGVVPLCAQLERVGEVPTEDAQDVPDVQDTSSQNTVIDYTADSATIDDSTATDEGVTSVEPLSDTFTDDQIETETEMVQDSGQVYKACPIPARDNRTIVDLTYGGTTPLNDLMIRADSEKSMARTESYRIDLPQGRYVVRYASYDIGTQKSIKSHMAWKVILFDNARTPVTLAGTSRGIPEWEHEYISKAETILTLRKDASFIYGVHTAYPDTIAYQFSPLCVSFDRIADVVEEHDATDPNEELEKVQTPSVQNDDAWGSVQTSTTVVAPTPRVISDEEEEKEVPEEIRQVPPEDLGLQSAMREVDVPATVAEKRQELVRTLDDAPLTVLLDGSKEEQEKTTNYLYLLATKGTTSVTEFPDTPVVRPKRVTREIPKQNVSPVQVKEYLRGVRAVEDRQGLESTRDTDGDGVSDYDEEMIFNTDPLDPFTGDSVLTDGERVLLGLDPTKDDLTPVTLESPKTAGEIRTNLYTIESITMESATSTDSGTSTPTARIRVAGKAQPLSFVTLYLYSSPVIVTVRTDAEGVFEYTFDETLDDGSHELYVANVNNSGKILARSEAAPFTKTALAVSYTPVAVSPTVDPVQASMKTTFTFILLLILILSIASVVWIGIRKTRTEEQKSNIEMHE